LICWEVDGHFVCQNVVNCVYKNQDLKLKWTKECEVHAYNNLPDAIKAYIKENGVGCCEVSQDKQLICWKVDGHFVCPNVVNCVHKNQNLKLKWTKECEIHAYNNLPHAIKAYIIENGVGCCEVSED
jgi:hypothetical protein